MLANEKSYRLNTMVDSILLKFTSYATHDGAMSRDELVSRKNALGKTALLIMLRDARALRRDAHDERSSSLIGAGGMRQPDWTSAPVLTRTDMRSARA